jgi:hypothetical protein
MTTDYVEYLVHLEERLASPGQEIPVQMSGFAKAVSIAWLREAEGGT